MMNLTKNLFYADNLDYQNYQDLQFIKNPNGIFYTGSQIAIIYNSKIIVKLGDLDNNYIFYWQSNGKIKVIIQQEAMDIYCFWRDKIAKLKAFE